MKSDGEPSSHIPLVSLGPLWHTLGARSVPQTDYQPLACNP